MVLGKLFYKIKDGGFSIPNIKIYYLNVLKIGKPTCLVTASLVTASLPLKIRCITKIFLSAYCHLTSRVWLDIEKIFNITKFLDFSTFWCNSSLKEMGNGKCKILTSGYPRDCANFSITLYWLIKSFTDSIMNLEATF